MNFSYYKEFILNEALGINKNVMEFSKILESFIYVDIQQNKISNSFELNNDLGIDKINITYINNKSSTMATISVNNKDIYLIINTHYYNKQDMLITLNHELLHIYSEINGYNQSDEYKKLLTLSNKYDPNDGYTGRLIYILYFFSHTEMNSMIQELYIEIQNNIKNKKEFNDYILNNQIYQNIKYVEKLNLNDLWNKIINEETSEYLLNYLNIKNLDKWLNKKEKYLKNNAESFKKKIFRMSELFDRKS